MTSVRAPRPEPPHRPDRRVTVLAHGAERTGPPVGLAHLLRWVAGGPGDPVDLVLARGGDLLDDYRATTGSVTVVSRGREPLEPAAAALRRLGRPGAAASAGRAWTRHRLRHLPPPAAIYLNSVSGPTLGLLGALPHDAPLVVHVHEMGIGLGAVDAAGLGTALDRARAVVAASAAVAEVLVADHQVDPDRITVAHELVDTDAVARSLTALGRDAARRHLGAAPGSFLVVGVGLPDWRKAPELLLHALWELRRTRPEVDLRVAWIGGDPTGEDGRRLADEARRLGVADRVAHHPHTADPVALLAGADAFALPSREDAFPLAALEAAAAGLPIVSFRSGGMVELVDDTVGALVDYPDVTALAAALGALAQDPASARARGEAARARVTARHDVAVGAPRIWAVVERAGADGDAS